jgi:hypothetical protein
VGFFVASRRKVRGGDRDAGAGQSAAGSAVGGVTAGLLVGWFFAVARVSRSADRAWIWRCTAAGLNEACWAFRRRRRSGLTPGWAIARA